MHTAGVDVGAATTKAAVLEGDKMVAYHIMPTGAIIEKTIETVTKKTLEKAGISMNDLDYIVSTGWGRSAVAFANKSVTEIACHAAGAKWSYPEARTIIDIGGQDSKAISLGENGEVIDFAMNDKCAAGTGRFLEVMSNILETEVTKLGSLALASKDPCVISSTCTVFAETEVISNRARGRSVEDIIAGVIKAMIKRVVQMSMRLKIKDAVVFTGGVAKNIAAKTFLGKELQTEVIVLYEPQIIGALGAALIAQRDGCI
jgi:predicted CoA-substrate-specific enzyme activase